MANNTGELGDDGSSDNVRRRRLLKTVGSITTLSFAGCASSESQTQQESGASSNSKTPQKTEDSGVETFDNQAGNPIGANFDQVKELAKQESGITVYATITREPFKNWVDGFQEKHPNIDVQYVTGGSSKLLQRWTSEYKSDQVEGDILITNGVTTAVGKDQVQKLSSDIMPEYGNMSDKFKDPEGHWVGLRLKLGNVFYNTDMVSEDDVESWMDLVTSDRWADQKIGWDPTPNLALMKWLFNTQGEEFFQNLADQNPRFVDSHTDLARLCGAGSFPVAFTYTHKMAQFGNDLPIDYFKFDPTPAVISPAAINNKAPNPNSALLFLNWLSSVEGQKILAERYIPVRSETEYQGFPGVYPSEKYEVDTIVPNYEQRKKVQEQWKSVMGDRLSG